MKKTSFLLILLLGFGISLSISCEPDDICPASTPTTPSLIIDLYDVENPENRKALTATVIKGTDNNFLLTNGIVALPRLTLPLKTDVNSTQYAIIKDAVINNNGTPDDTTDDFISGNQDIITINYTREEVYVSRACGYKTIYKNVTLTVNEPDADKWIKSRQPVTDNQSVENETATHFIILH